MSKTDTLKLTLKREEWDFSEVLESEVMACFLWECCREWEELLWLVKKSDHNAVRELSKKFLDPGLTTLFYRTPAATILPSDPWQSLSDFRRQKVVSLVTPAIESVGFASKSLHDAIFTHFNELHERSDAPVSDYALLRLNWLQSDNQMLEDFAAWLLRNRKVVANENRGSQPRNWLKMIGAMRLLHHFTFDEAYALSRDVLGKPLYGKRPSWERARKGALEAFRNRFFMDSRMLEKPPVPLSYPKRVKLIASMHPDGL